MAPQREFGHPPDPTVCRYCLKKRCSKDIYNVFYLKGIKEVYSEMLSETFNVPILCSKDMSKQISHLICEQCIQRLRDASTFRKQVLKSEQALQQYLSQTTQDFMDQNGQKFRKVPTKQRVRKCAAKGFKVPESEQKFRADNADEEAESKMLEEWIDEEAESYHLLTYDSDVTCCEDDPSEHLLADQDVKEENEEIKKENEELKEESEELNEEIEELKEETEEPKEETTFKPNEMKTRKRKATEISKQKKSAIKKAKKRATPKKRKNTEAKDTVLIIVDDEADAAKINAQIIVKFSSVYPFKMTNFRNRIGCSYCKETFSEPVKFRNHVDTAHNTVDKIIAVTSPHARLTRVDVSNITCKICQKIVPTIEDIATHLQGKHDLDINLNEGLGLVPIKLDQNELECVVCSEKAINYCQISRHTSEHYALNICYVCGRKLESKNANCAHGGTKAKISYFCDKCKQSFPTAHDKKRHFRANKKCLRIKCRECGERFTCYEKKQRHLAEIHGKPIKTYPCTQCAQTFPYRTMLNKHFHSKHTDNYKCNYCDMRFWSNVTLATHVAKTHTLERTYKCNLCEKRYFQKSQLKIHMVVHDDSIKFACKNCDAMFIRRYRLRDHIVKHHPTVDVDLILKTFY